MISVVAASSIQAMLMAIFNGLAFHLRVYMSAMAAFLNINVRADVLKMCGAYMGMQCIRRQKFLE
jgi:hypothetical protein